jgi:two-component system OmpR family sensor kinase
MRTIKQEATRMGTLVDDLLWLAQLDHERPLRRESVDLGEVVRRSAAGVAVSAPDRPLDVEVRSPVTIVGDEQRLRQVVDNLLVNAVRHTPGGTAIEVTLTQDADWAVLTVHDEGPGIDPADAGRIFQPFYRSDPSRARTSGGAGLGLAIVAAIVGSHGGTVVVRPGRGATFEVRLPKTQTQADQTQPDRTQPDQTQADRTQTVQGVRRGDSGGDVPDRPLDDLAGTDA